MDDLFKMHGTVLVRKNGVILLKQSNMIVTTGRTLSAARLGSNTPGPISHMAVGTSGTAPATGQTSLQAQLNDRVAVAFTPNGAFAKFEAQFGVGAWAGSIAEAGLFNAATGGSMMSRVVFATPIPKNSDDSISFEWNIEVQV